MINILVLQNSLPVLIYWHYENVGKLLSRYLLNISKLVTNTTFLILLFQTFVITNIEIRLFLDTTKHSFIKLIKSIRIVETFLH